MRYYYDGTAHRMVVLKCNYVDLSEWFVSSVFGRLHEDTFTVFDVCVPLRPRERHGGTDERHLTVQSVLGCRILS